MVVAEKTLKKIDPGGRVRQDKRWGLPDDG